MSPNQVKYNIYICVYLLLYIICVCLNLACVYIRDLNACFPRFCIYVFGYPLLTIEYLPHATGGIVHVEEVLQEARWRYACAIVFHVIACLEFLTALRIGDRVTNIALHGKGQGEKERQVLIMAFTIEFEFFII